MEIIELSLTVDNVQDWSYVEGVREIVQGFLDNTNEKSWTYKNNTLMLRNKDTQLDRKVLLTGFSTKRNDPSQRGRYGDGLGSGLCCLVREGFGVKITNGSVIWTPVIERSNKFGEDVLAIQEESGDEYNEDFIVEVSGLSEEQFKVIYDNTLYFQDEIGEVHETPKGDILLAPKFKNKIYCGGLFVSELGGMGFGYDFKPEHLPLDRDRMSVRDFDAKWATGEMWAYVNNKSEVTEASATALVEALHNNSSDVRYSHMDKVDTQVADKVFEVYKEQYEGKILAEDYDETKKLEASGYRNVVNCGKAAFVRVLKQSEGYKTIQPNIVMKNPNELLDDFKDSWYDNFTTEMLDEWEDLKANINKLL